MRINLAIIVVAICTLNYSCGGAEEEALCGNSFLLDHRLDKVVRDAIGKPCGDLVPEDVAELTSLDARYKFIDRLDGIEKIVNLEELKLSQNSSIEISPISELYKLKKLELRMIMEGDESPILLSDISPLGGLINLEELDIGQNRIEDIRALKDLVKMRRLKLDRNYVISDIMVITGMTELTYLELENNKIEKLDYMESLKKLKYVNISNNKLMDIQPLSQLVGLNSLYLDDNKLDNIEPLSKFRDLASLGLDNTGVADIGPLKSLEGIRELGLFGNNIVDVGPLVENSGIGKDDVIYIWRNPIDWNSPEQSANLKKLLDRGVDIITVGP
jgi:internalin A